MYLSFEQLDIINFGSFAKQRFDLRTCPIGLNFLRGRNEYEPRLESNGCLLGSTLIDCPRDLIKFPKGIPIKDLVGKKFLTYSWDNDNETIVLSSVNKVWKTGYKKIYKVSLTAYPNGRDKIGNRRGGAHQGKYLPPCELIGTYDHLVMLADGSWKKLGELEPKDSLKSFYRREADRGLISWSDNIKKVRKNIGWQKNVKRPFVYYALTKAVNEQQFVCASVNGPRPKDADVHHKDENDHNHHPDNLEWKNSFLHQSDHLRSRNLKKTTGWQKYGIHPRGMLGKTHTDKSKQKISKTLHENWSIRKGIVNHIVKSSPICIGKDWVYDMEVETTHSFVANGVIVHNSGKSTLFSALTWCFYGKTVDGLRNPDVAPWSGKTPTSVETTIIKGKNTHSIYRTIGPNRLTIDGDPVGQEQIDKLIGLSFEVFTHTILLGQGQPLFFDLRPADKMKVFAEVLNLEKWVARSKAATSRALSIQQDFDIKTGELNGIDNTIAEVQSLIDTTTKKSMEWESDREGRIEDNEKAIAALKSQSAEHRKRLDKATLDHEGASTEAKALEKELTKLKDVINTDMGKSEQFRFQIEATNREIGKQQRELDQLGKADKCPTCGQGIKGTNLHKHKREIQNRIDELNDEVRALEKKRKVIDLEKYNEKLDTLNTAFDGFKDKTYDAETRIKHYTGLINELRVKIDTLQNTVNELANNNNPHQEQIRLLKKRKSKLIRDKDEFEDYLKTLTARLERTRFWIKGFKDVQLYVINEVLQELEMVSNSMLPDVGLDDWRISYAIEKETQSGSIQRGLNVTITSPSNDKPVKWECWSGGEAQRLRLVGSLSLSDVLLNHAGINTNLEILDEPSQHLSRTGVRDLCPFLAERARQSSKIIFLVDHAVIPSSEFASVITVVKSPKRVSMIIEE